MIPLSHGLILTSILFVLGITSLITLRNLFFVLISLEIMMNASAFTFILLGNYWGQIEGQIMYVLLITIAASEASISLALLLKFYRVRQTLNIDLLSEVKK